VSAFAVSTERMSELRSRERLIAREIDRDGIELTTLLEREGWRAAQKS
jgi:hypothetical protein